MWDTVKAIMRGKLISRTAYLNKMKRLKYDELEKTLRELEKQTRLTDQIKVQKKGDFRLWRLAEKTRARLLCY